MRMEFPTKRLLTSKSWLLGQSGSTTKTHNVRVENYLGHLAVVVGLKIENRLHLTGCRGDYDRRNEYVRSWTAVRSET